ncbi:MAG: flagellar motor switch protein FliG [Paracoccaceae bacterium]
MPTALTSATETTPIPTPQILNGRQKAAIVVRLLLSEGANLSLTDLSEETQAELILQMARLRHIDNATLQSVVDEFASILEAGGLNFPGALEGTLKLLDGTISVSTAQRLRRQAGLSRHGDPWKRISGFDTEILLPVLETKSIEVGAVILSKLKVSKAAEILGRLPGERARRITFAISLTGNIAPDMVLKIGHTIAAQMDAQPISAFAEGPVERVGAILNFSPATTREDVLDGLEQADSGFATEVRRAIFTFANIPARIDPRDVPKIVRDVDPTQLIIALAAATGKDAASTEFILTNMSKRMAEQIREEITEMGKIKPADGDAAMTTFIASIRELESTGEIFLVAEDD